MIDQALAGFNEFTLLAGFRFYLGFNGMFTPTPVVAYA